MGEEGVLSPQSDGGKDKGWIQDLWTPLPPPVSSSLRLVSVPHVCVDVLRLQSFSLAFPIPLLSSINLRGIARVKDGRRPLLKLLHPKSTQYFSPNDLTSLGLSIPSLSEKGELHGSEVVVDDWNNEDASICLNEGGKKDSFKRRQELLVDSGLAESQAQHMMVPIHRMD